MKGTKIFEVLLISLGIFFFSLLDSLWAGRCGPPPYNYNPDTDSYIVIEGTISGLPASYVKALPAGVDIPRENLPRSCFIYFNARPQTPSHPYYCLYVVFKDTSTKKECWRYFQNLRTLNVRPHSILVMKSGHHNYENWIPQPSSKRVSFSQIYYVK